MGLLRIENDRLGPDLPDALAQTVGYVDEILNTLIPKSREDERTDLISAMRYSTLNGGKKLRPFFVLASAELFSVSQSCALRTAAAVEMLHCYSLIHDDLPAMDNSDIRRGLESCHVHYDEATAILAGDALLTMAFGVLADEATHTDAKVRCELIAGLSKAAGPWGMVGGQALDMLAIKGEFDIGEVTRLQRLKTGEIFGFACEAGAILGKAAAPKRHALQAYAQNLGLAFQITDDLLDVEGQECETGKMVRRDVDAGKATFVSILGLERARHQAHLLAEQAIQHLDIFGSQADLLKQAARYIVDRRS